MVGKQLGTATDFPKVQVISGATKNVQVWRNWADHRARSSYDVHLDGLDSVLEVSDAKSVVAYECVAGS